MRAPALLCLAAALLISACTSAPESRYTVPEVAAPDRVGVSFRSIEVLDVSLPTYAALEEIAVAMPGGVVENATDGLWADDPERAVTLELSRALSLGTGATIAPEPWPFRGPPDATLDIRVEDMVAGDTGIFHLNGQYFVAPDDTDRRPRARLFDLKVPFDREGGFPAIAAARGAAVAQLAALIAREGLR